jgi:HAD superfamily hydrolase (TIGR01509 family)
MSVAFLFDNDGVLIDSSALHWKAWQRLMQEDAHFKMDETGFIKGFGKRNDLILKEAAPYATVEKHKHWADRKEKLFRECARGNVSLLPGMEAFLKKVSQSNIPRIIASSTPRENLEMYIESTVLGQYFSDFLSGEEVNHGKPAPDIFIAAAHRLGFEPANCIVFEDAPAGVMAGKAAGCFVVALETTHVRQQLAGYDLVYPSAEALDLDEILHTFFTKKK